MNASNGFRGVALLGASLFSWCALAQSPQPWMDPHRSPDERARLAVAAMSLEEKISLLHGPMAIPFISPNSKPLPSDAILSAGYIPGIPRLGIPALKETDASLGVVDMGGMRQPCDSARSNNARISSRASGLRNELNCAGKSQKLGQRSLVFLDIA